jgi:serine protease Do
VGINSQIYSRTGGFQGLSFSIPIDLAYKIKDQILEHGKVQHARLGVTVQEVNQDLADSFKLDSPSGALVSSVEKGSAADKAGLQPGDVVRKIDGKTIVSSGDLASTITMAAPGEKIKLDVWRNGGQKEMVATLGGVPKDKTQASADGQEVQRGQLGLALRPLSPQEQQEAGAEGLLIERSAGPAAKAGIQPGDVLLSLNGVPVHNVGQVKAELSKAGKTVALLVQRGEDKIFVPVQIG